MCPDCSVLLLYSAGVLFVGYFSGGYCCSDEKSSKVLNLVPDWWEKVVRVWSWGENGCRKSWVRRCKCACCRVPLLQDSSQLCLLQQCQDKQNSAILLLKVSKGQSISPELLSISPHCHHQVICHVGVLGARLLMKHFFVSFYCVAQQLQQC